MKERKGRGRERGRGREGERSVVNGRLDRVYRSSSSGVQLATQQATCMYTITFYSSSLLLFRRSLYYILCLFLHPSHLSTSSLSNTTFTRFHSSSLSSSLLLLSLLTSYISSYLHNTNNKYIQIISHININISYCLDIHIIHIYSYFLHIFKISCLNIN